MQVFKESIVLRGEQNEVLRSGKKKEDQMIKKLIVVIMAGILFVSFTLFMDAQPNPQEMMKRMHYGIRMAEQNLIPGKILIRMKDKIGLSEKQVQQIQKLDAAFQEAQIMSDADAKVKYLKVKNYLKEEKINRSKLEKMIWDVAKLKTQMQVDRINYLLDVKSFLTAEQITKIEEMKKNFRRGAFRKMREKRGISRRSRR